LLLSEGPTKRNERRRKKLRKVKLAVKWGLQEKKKKKKENNEDLCT
jgi:hypothetical protein